MSAAQPIAPLAASEHRTPSEPTRGDAGLQARLLRNLAAWLDEHADKPLPVEIEETIAETFEDLLDNDAADAALAEPSETVPWDAVKRELGL
jgi:hypothetical protein